MPTTLRVSCSDTTSNVLSMTIETLTGTDIGAIGSPFAARARRSWNLTGEPANSASKNVSSPVNCGATAASGRCTDVKSAAGRTARPPPRPANAPPRPAAPRPCNCACACCTASVAFCSASCAWTSACSAAPGAGAAANPIAAFAP